MSAEWATVVDGGILIDRRNPLWISSARLLEAQKLGVLFERSTQEAEARNLRPEPHHAFLLATDAGHQYLRTRDERAAAERALPTCRQPIGEHIRSVLEFRRVSKTLFPAEPFRFAVVISFDGDDVDRLGLEQGGTLCARLWREP